MRTVIAGSRDIPHDRAVELVRDAIQASGWAGEISMVIHGGCRGIDNAAHQACEGLWPVKVCPANWAKHGKAAGPIRNREMAAMADALIAIWDGQSRGTKNMIDEANGRGLKAHVYFTAPTTKDDES
jgi:hypothetical protein